jgi:hypothetical protein
MGRGVRLEPFVTEAREPRAAELVVGHVQHCPGAPEMLSTLHAHTKRP